MRIKTALRDVNTVVMQCGSTFHDHCGLLVFERAALKAALIVVVSVMFFDLICIPLI